MIKSRKQMFIVIGVFALVMLLGTVTYAFFNYTRTGSSNTIRVGRIAFTTNQNKTITLNNLFPIDPTDSEAMSDDTKVGTLEIEIEGDTDYSGGIEYLVSSENTHITTSSGNVVPISLDVTINSLGTESSSYWETRENTNASIYKRLVGDTLKGDERILVGFIKPNTTSGTAEGIDGKITIKAYLNKNKILISDTYDGTESDNMGTPNSLAEGKTVLTTSEWNALKTSGISFKVKVEANEGIWADNPNSLYGIMKKNAVMDNISSTFVSSSSGIDFGAISSDTNGKGVYERAGTENDEYPIYYYRGAVEDNNVLFANKCWKAVITTDTGGVKLIYNGELSYNKRALERSEYGELVTNTGNYTFDERDDSWHATMTETVWDDAPIEMSFKLPVGKYYYVISGTTSSVSDVWAELGVYVNDDLVDDVYGYEGELITGIGLINVSENTDIISLQLYGDSTSSNPSNVSVKFLKEEESLGTGCDNEGTDTQISLSGTTTFVFNTSSNSPAHVGYMYGDVYAYNQGVATSGAYFGSSFIWDGTNYKLLDPITTKNNTHHYTCNLTSADGTCTTIRYYYYGNNYVNLTGGDGIEEAMTKMQTNTNDSNAKDKIDTWYASNLTSYTNKLEDTIWCNDRSFGDNNNNGWIANGGDLSTYLYYGAYQRSNYASNTSTVKNQPSLACANKNDRFTVNNANGNGALTYPVALLTEDEMVLAGGLARTKNTTFYLNNGNSNYWSLSPDYFGNYNAVEFKLDDDKIDCNSVINTYGLRPAVSLKPGTPVVSGTGTVSDPFVIE